MSKVGHPTARQISDPHPAPRAAAASTGTARFGYGYCRADNVSMTQVGSLKPMDGERDAESDRREYPDQLTAVLECLGHHRVGEHREYGPGGEGKDKGHRARGSVLKEEIAEQGSNPRDEDHA